MIFLRNFSITTLNDIVYFRRKKWFLCENYYKILENEEKSWFSVCDELWRDLNPFYLIDYIKIQRLKTKIFIRYRSELANSSQSCFRATISRPRNKHPLVFNFRLTRIDIVSILLVIIKIRNRNKIRDLSQPIISSEARGLRDLIQPITSSEARGLRDLGKPIISSEARA